MKPNFALDLSHDGINLLHRGKGGWSLVGSVALDDPELAVRLSDLRKIAAQLESGGFTTKLIIPNSQVLYTTVEATGPDDIAREVQIRAALDGLTPYPVGELVFDWRAQGKEARVAVCARETMDEAESFAAEYKFNPISFVARPGRGEFSGEPFFGKTKAATRLLAPGERIEPDATAVPRQGKAKELSPEDRTDVSMQEPEQAPTSTPVEAPAPAPKAARPAPIPPKLDDPFAELDALAAELSGDGPIRAPAAEAASTEEAPAPRKKRAPRDDAARVIPPALAPFPPTPDEANDMPMPRPVLPPRTARPKREIPEAAKPAAVRSEMPPLEKPSTPVPAAEGPEASAEPSAPAPTRPPLPPGLPPEPAPHPVAPKAADDRPDAEGTEADTPLAFSSQRSAAKAQFAAESAAPTAPSAAGAPQVGLPLKPEDDLAPAPNSAAPVASRSLVGASPSVRIRSEMAEALAKPLPRPGDTPPKASSGPGKGAQISTAIRELTARLTPAKPAPADESEQPARRFRLSLPQRSKSPERSEEEARRAREAEALTIFGARKSQDVGGKPKYLGLILTLLLLLVMAIIVVWSSFFVQDGQVSLFNPSPEVEIATADGSPDLVEAPIATESTTPETDPTTEVIAGAPSTATLPGTAEVLSPEMAEARYAATGIWQRAPEILQNPEVGHLALRDLATLAPVSSGRKLAALPDTSSDSIADLARAEPIPPPSPGTSFALNENGLVEPKPDGALSPAGILVYAGRPTLVPPSRPGTAAAEAPAPAPDTAAEAPETAPADTPDAPASDLPGTRPQPRPTGLALNDTADAADTAAPPETEDAALAIAATGAIDAAIDDAIASVFDGATELAVAASRVPSRRPANFASLVDAAHANASDGSVVVAAAAAPATTVPAIPTSASVATRATMENALNLREINVVGIYGTSNARRALVRLTNGRYVKVKVGDKLDGGKVTSITASQLTYQKGSRAYTLDVLPLG